MKENLNTLSVDLDGALIKSDMLLKLFGHHWQKQNIRSIGAILGLTLGYTLKYKLNNQYVFKKQNK